MQFNEVPIACVEPSWLTDEFLPAVAGKLADSTPSVFGMPTDSHQESEFLAARLARHLRDQGVPFVRELRLSPTDPTLEWELLFGTPDHCGTFDLLSECDVLIVRGGNYLPMWFMEEHLHRLRSNAESHHTHIVIPLSRSVASACIRIGECLDVPTLKDVPEPRLREYVASSIDEVIDDVRDEGSIDRSAARQELCDIIVAGHPRSRSIVKVWLEHYLEEFARSECGSVLEVARRIPPDHVMTGFPEPARIPARKILKAEFDDALHSLHTLNAMFRETTGYRLFRNNHDLPHPFDASDPQYWFIGCVSNLGSLFFDAGKKNGLAVATQYVTDNGTGDIVSMELNPFTKSLRLLRTYFQHGLDPDDTDDRRTLAAVRDWFSRVLGAGQTFSRENARLSLVELLSQYRTCVSQLSNVVANLEQCPTSYALKSQLERNARTFAEHEVERAINSVVDRLELDVEPSEVKRLSLDAIMSKLKNSTCRLTQMNMNEELLRIVENYCLDAARRPPQIGAWLKKQGLQGRQIGECNRQLMKAWDDDATMTKDQFMLMAEKLTLKMKRGRQPGK